VPSLAAVASVVLRRRALTVMDILLVVAIVIVLLPLSGVTTAHAAIVPASMFTTNAVLQRDMAAPVWGTADPHEPITVSINGQSASTTADARGQWSLKLPPLAAGGPFTLTFAGHPGDTLTRQNILVGDVWFCGGQSNMEYPLQGVIWAQRPSIFKSVIASCADPMIRYLNVNEDPNVTPQASFRAIWQELNPQTAPELSAVGYFFGRNLRKSLGVPIGLISASYGGSPAEAWVSQDALQSNPVLAHYLEDAAKEMQKYQKDLAAYTAHQADYRMAKSKFDTDAAKAAGTPLPTAPVPPKKPFPMEKSAYLACRLFNGMVAPVLPYAIKGTIWYQGESNTASAYEYQTLLPALMADWRAHWGQGDFPFLIVQIAPYKPIEPGPVLRSDWAEMREAQRRIAAADGHSGLVVLTDLGEENDVHPKRKEPVGDRLALLARAKAYGETIEYSGPVLDSATVEGARIRVHFTHAEGLHACAVRTWSDDDARAYNADPTANVGTVIATPDKLVGFEMAGEDQVYHSADAAISGATVVVSSPAVLAPVAVRYAWATFPVGNLSNGAGLPASPFTTDTWRWSTQGTPK